MPVTKVRGIVIACVIRSFVTGGPSIPVCVGTFGEMNKTLDSIIDMIAQLAAKTHHDQTTISPTSI
jgi:hypothetical protein